MATDCGSKCDEHGDLKSSNEDLKSSVLVVKWMCSFILLFLVTIVAGTSYAVLQNHRAEIKLVLLQDTVHDNGEAFIEARSKHDDSIDDLYFLVLGEYKSSNTRQARHNR